MSIKDITVVITSFKSENKIKICLNSIDKQCRVLLVENSNNLNFKKNIEAEYDNVDCILTGHNFGYGKANNIGLKKVKTKYALILNPDATLQASTLEVFLSTAKQLPEFAIIAPHIKEKNNLKDITAPVLVKNVKGFAMFLNLEKFNEVGFFDENFFMYFEEIDLCQRLTKLNKKIYLIPNLKIDHEGGQSHNSSINQIMEISRNWHWMWSTFYYHKKHKGFIISFILNLPRLLSSILKLLFYWMTFNKYKKDIYYQRFSGLLNAIMGKSSWYRPEL